MTATIDSARDAAPEISSFEKARILAQALPFMQRYTDETVVIKYGGHAMGEERIAALFAQDIAMLKQAGVRPVVVHGGGPQIGAMLNRLGIQTRFDGGLRVTDKQTVEVVEMVLAGSINKQIVTEINKAGGRAVGLSGKDGSLIVARKLKRTMTDPDSNIERILDLGFVGEPEKVTPDILLKLCDSDIIPVVAPIGVSREGVTYNINADTAAGAVASALHAKRLLMLTDVPGVLGADGELITELPRAEARRLLDCGVISGGMIPKIETCMDALAAGVEAVVVLDGRVEHAVLLELFTEHGVGTLIS
jgi:acetylglutamate kinase